MVAKVKSRRASPVPADLVAVPVPVTTSDRIVLEIRRFIAAVIFFNTQAAEKVGLGLTDLQMVHMLQLYGPSTPGRLAIWTGLSSGGVTVALDRLERAGYVRRARNPVDRRSLLVTLVPAPDNGVCAALCQRSLRPIRSGQAWMQAGERGCGRTARTGAARGCRRNR